MATFKFGRYIDIHWNGYDIQGPADTVFSIPDQLYEEFDSDIAPVEPTLQWIDTNEFATLSASVSASTLSATAPITIASTSTGRIISFSSGTALNGYLLSADGSGGAIWNPASTSGLTSVVGVSPVSAAVSGGVVSVSLNANYQTAGTYVTGVVGTAPISTTGTTSITISVDQTAITANSATNAEVLRTPVKNSSGSTITKGQVVYVTGADGTNALIGLSTASTEAGSSKTLGIAANTMTNNAFGYVVENGTLAGIDTSSTTAGASIWLGNTPGSLVFGAPPAEPSHSVYLGVVTKANPSTGEILVKVQNGYELDELHDVSAASPSDGDILQYKTSSTLWTKSSIAGAGIAASSHTHAYQPSGTYVNAVIGTSPASVLTASGTSTVSIIASSINSTHIADNAIVAAKIAAASVGTAKISSGAATSGQLLQADGLGAAIFATIPSSGSVNIAEFTASGTWTKPSGVKAVYVFAVGAGGGGAGGATDGAGGGGSGGGIEQRIFDASILGSTASVTIGSGGSGGAGIAGVASTTGNGTGGGNTTFGTIGTGLLVAYGGRAGQCSNSDVVASTTRAPAVSAGGSNDTLTNTLTVVRYAGRGGRAGTNSSAGNINAGSSQTGAGGGGGGGLVSSSGGDGGRGISGDTGTATAGGAAGANGSNATNLYFGGGGGGGGNTATGGNGGTGLRGGGGGGGGRANTTGGNGAAGGDGYCLVISW